MEDDEIVKEFLIESNENLGRLDQEMVELEQRPGDADLLASIFRTFHTIKGTCGFLGFSALEAIAHHAESILSQVRSATLELSPPLVSLILRSVDRIKQHLTAIEHTGAEEGGDDLELLTQLKSAASGSIPAPRVVVPATATPAEAAQAAGEADIQSTQKTNSVIESTIRINVDLLDKLMNLVGELVLARNQILQFTASHRDPTLNATSQRLNLITSELQEGVMKTRMQPIGVVWNKLPRMVRDIGTALHKQIQLEMEGAETELDKTIIEAIKDPLTHIVRNCCDHGIEPAEVRVSRGKPAHGKLQLRAFHEGGQVNIEITDDGGGIDVSRVKSKAVEKGIIRREQAERMSDREAFNLIFLPGFSTAATVSNVSGRGVGMDVVKTNIEKIGGVVDLMSRPGEGTTVKFKIPLTLAIIPGLLVTSGGERFVIPQASLLELIRLEGDSGGRQIEWIHGTPVYRRRGKLLPIAYLNQVLRLPAAPDTGVVNIVVLQAEDKHFGLVVDKISDTQEIVVKPLGKQLKGLSCYAGATIMGDGHVALILDVFGIGRLSGVVNEPREAGRADLRRLESGILERQAYLLFRAGSHERLAVPLSLVARLEEFPRARIEHGAGRLVAQYRGTILPLQHLHRLLEPSSGIVDELADPCQVIVFDNGERSIGIIVDRILDIVEEAVTMSRETSRPGLIGSAVIARRVTDILDLQTVLATAGEDWIGCGRDRVACRNGITVLIAGGAAFQRSLIRSYLEVAGYRVIEADGAEQALELLDRQEIGLVMTADDSVSPAQGLLIAERIHSHSVFSKIPVISVADSVRRRPGEGVAISPQLDRAAMLRALAEAIDGAAAPAMEGLKS